MNIELINKLWERTKLDNGCWLWLGPEIKGYGKVYYNRTYWIVSRLSLCIYLKVKYLNYNWDACHICNNRNCWNPLHLYIGSREDNIKDTLKKGSHICCKFATRNKLKTHCPFGHPYSGRNLYVAPDKSRNCRACKNKQSKKFEKRKRLERKRLTT